MEMERINENIIRIYLRSEDLVARGVDLRELVSNPTNIERFFLSLLEEVDVEQTFKDSDAITFQVVPNGKGLELYISRNAGAEVERMLEKNFLKRLPKDILESMGIKFPSSSEEKKRHYPEDFINQFDTDEVVSFASLNLVIEASRVLADFEVESSLYVKDETYYLVLGGVEEEIPEDEAYFQFVKMLEYGKISSIPASVIAEHARLIRQGDALQFFSQL